MRHHLRLDGLPSGPNCRGRYPWAIKGCRDYFSANVVAAIHIGVNEPLAAGIIPAPIPSATEARFLRPRMIINWDRIAVKEAGAARIALFRDDHRNSNKLGFVDEEVNEPSMRDLHKGLIVPLTHLHFLLPERVL